MSTDTKGIVVFLVLAFGVAWLLWEVAIQLGLAPGGIAFSLLVAAGAFAPALAATVVRTFVTREGFADAGLGLYPRSIVYFVAAWLIVLFVVAFVCLAMPALGFAAPDYSPAGALPLPTAVLQFTVGALAATPILWGEEFGWRGYLQLRLFPGRPLLAAIVTGLIWGVWHLPLLLLATELPQHPYLTLAIFPLGTVFYSIIFGWIRERSGSVWASSFAHSAINNLRSSLFALLFASVTDKLPIALLGLIPLALVSLAIVAFGGLRRAEQGESRAARV